MESSEPTGLDTAETVKMVVDEAVELADRWVGVALKVAPQRRVAGLRRLLADELGPAFAADFVDGVVRPNDMRAAGRALEALAASIPHAMPWWHRLALLVGGGFAATVPWPIVPLARRAFGSLAGHLVLDADSARLGRDLQRIQSNDFRINLSLLGEAVLGEAGAAARQIRTVELLKLPEVDGVSLRISEVVCRRNGWSDDQVAEILGQRVLPLLEAAASGGKFVVFDGETAGDLHLTVRVCEDLLGRSSLDALDFGMTVQAYLPQSLTVIQGLRQAAARRTARGGVPFRIRLVKGANLMPEQATAELHGWPTATFATRRQTDANFVRCLDALLRVESKTALKVSVASHNLYDQALAFLLASRRNLAGLLEAEMLLGVVPELAEAVSEDAGGVLIYTPVAERGALGNVARYLRRCLAELAKPDGFLNAYALATGRGVVGSVVDRTQLDREAKRLRVAVSDFASTPQSTAFESFRRQDRTAATEPAAGPFRNSALTDPSTPSNRRWMSEIFSRIPGSTRGQQTLSDSGTLSASGVQETVADARAATASWSRRTAAERARALEDVSDVLEVFRGRLIEVVASECGMTVVAADREVSDAVDHARWCANVAKRIVAEAEGAHFVPAKLVVVLVNGRSPLATTAAGVCSALAAGSSVILQPGTGVGRSAAVFCDAFWEGGVPREVLRLQETDASDSDHGGASRTLISHPDVDRVLLTGSRDAAQLFRTWRSDTALLAQSGGNNAVIVTASADLDEAASHLVTSAFGESGQGISAVSLAILVGSVGSNEKFRRQLADAVTSIRVGEPSDPLTDFGRKVNPADAVSLRALTRLDARESWLVEPKLLDADDQLWSPGVREGVEAGSWFYLTHTAAPVLGLLTVPDLEDAIRLQNAYGSGLSAGLHSRDPREIALWLSLTQAGNAAVNQPITEATVGRQPLGGGKRSNFGCAVKTGGPNVLVPLGDWLSVEAVPEPSIRIAGIGRNAASVLKRAQPMLDFPEFDFVRRAAVDDEKWWLEEFGAARDLSVLQAQRNVFRYQPAEVLLRLAERARPAELIRLLCAAAVTGAAVSVSTAVPLPTVLLEALRSPAPPLHLVSHRVESDAVFLDGLRNAGSAGSGPDRIRLITASPEDAAAMSAAVSTALQANTATAIFSGAVTASGRVELLTFLWEQVVSIATQRFGIPDPHMLALKL